jgi:RimJ/RimL family protein N-acetyltransferase
MVNLDAFDKEFFTKAVEWYKNPEYLNRVEMTTLPLTEKQIADILINRINDPHGKIFGIRKGEKPIGYIVLKNINLQYRSAEVHSYLAEDYGKGYGIIAVEKLLKYAFYELGLNRVFTSVYDFEKEVIEVMEKSPFVNEGKLRQAIYKNGKYFDVVIYSILKKEFHEYLVKKTEKDNG